MTADRHPKLLADLAEHAARIVQERARFDTGEAFIGDRTSRDSVLYNFVVLGEIARRFGSSFQRKHPELPWRAMIAQRDVIAHGYDAIDWTLFARDR